MINNDGVKLEDMAINLACDGKVIAEIIIDDAVPTPDNLGMKFTAIAHVTDYNIQFIAVRRFTDEEEAFYRKDKS